VNGNYGGSVAFSGNKVILNPGLALDRAADYYITVDTGALKGSESNVAFSTNNMGNISSPFYFTTEAAAQVDPGYQLTTNAQSPDYDYNGNITAGQMAGMQVEAAGDVDGDGVMDYIFGSSNYVYNASIPDDPNLAGTDHVAKGLFYLVFGQAGQWADLTTIDQLKAAGRVVTFYGTAINQLVRATEFGDLNHDGYNDLILTSGGQNPVVGDNTASDTADKDSGAVFVIYGKDRADWKPLLSADNLGEDGLIITGGLPQDQYGFSVATGDFNNDGFVDILSGMPTNQRDGYDSGEAFIINGGDFTDSLMQSGTTGNDLLIGDFNANRLAGGAGNDTIHSLGGADIIRGGGGDDVISISKLDFILIDGGTNDTTPGAYGKDTLLLKGHGMDLDMTGFAGSSLRSFEAIDLTGDGANHLTINYREVVLLLERQMTTAYGTYTELSIKGSNESSVTLEGPWAVMETVTDASNITWVRYALEGIYVKVQAAVAVELVDWVIPFQGATIDFAQTTNAVSVNLSSDTLLGANGTDTVLASTAVDVTRAVDTLASIEVVQAGNGNDLMVGGSNADTFLTGSGNDTVRGGAGGDTVFAGAGNDSILGDDTTAGQNWTDVLWGESGNDTLQGASGNDVLQGGTGADVLYGGTSTVSVTGSGNDLLDGGTGNDVLYGSDGNDTLLGGDGADSLVGGDGNDSLVGGAGADTLMAEAGDDVIVYDANDSVDGGAGYDTLLVGDEVRDLSSSTVVSKIESIDLRGHGAQWLRLGSATLNAMAAPASATLTIHGDVGDTLLLGGTVVWQQTRNVTIDGVLYKAAEIYDTTTLKAVVLLSSNLEVVQDSSAPSYAGAYLSGSAAIAINTLYTPANETVSGSGGNDHLYQSIGYESLDGGDGIDTLDFATQTGNVYVNQSASLMTVRGVTVGSGTALDGFGDIDALANIENIITGSGNDVVFDNATKASVIVTHAGADSIVADAGNDTIDAGSGSDTVLAGTGDDWIEGGDGNDSLSGDAGNDTLRGGSGNDTIDGGSDSDTVDYTGQTEAVVVNLTQEIQRGVAAGRASDGQGGMDTLLNLEAVIGGSGDDVIYGKSGRTTLFVGGVRFIADVPQGTSLSSGSSVVVVSEGTTTAAAKITVGGVAFTADGKYATDVATNHAITAISNATTGGVMTLDGGLGSDILIAGSGGDSLVFDKSDVSIVGGNGSDTLLINTPSVDFTSTWQMPAISGIEVIRFNTESPQSISLDKAAVARMVGNSSTLTIEGGIEDSVTVNADLGTALASGQTGYNASYATYVVDGVTLRVANSIGTQVAGAQLFKGTEGDNNLTVTNTTADALWGYAGNDTLSGDDGADSLFGGAGNDSLIGGLGTDSLVGGLGNDTLFGGVENDTLLGGDGDDTLVWDVAYSDTNNNQHVSNVSLLAKTADATVDGGAGFDTLQMGGNSYDFTNTNGTTGITNVELIDLRGRNATSVVLNRAAVAAMTDGNKVLRIDGDVGDTLVLDDWGFWTRDLTSDAQINGTGAKIYTATYNGATVTVQFSNNLSFTDKTTNTANTDLLLNSISGTGLVTGTAAAGTASVPPTGTVSITPLTAPSTFLTGTVTGTSSDDTLTLEARTASVSAAAGEDTLTTNLALTDLTVGVKPSLSSVEVIELGDNASGYGNALRLNVAQITAMTVGKVVRIEGDWGDTLNLTDGTWKLSAETLQTGTYIKYVNSTDANMKVYVDPKVSVSYSSAWANASTTLATITGTSVNEVFSGSAAYNQTIDGGGGSDTADYSYATVVTANLNTGVVAEGSGTVVDQLISIENVVSGAGSDLLIGNEANNLLDARAGNDLVYGGAGNDTLMGVGGADKLYAGSGSDVLYFDKAASVIDGGADDKVTHAQMLTIAQGVTGTRTESATVTFADMTANQVLTLGGRTFTASSTGAKAAEVASAFMGTVVTGTGALTGTLTGFTVTSAGSGVVVFTSTTATSDVTDLSIGGTVDVDVRSVDSNTGLIAVTRDGGTAAEKTTVTFADMVSGQSITLGGLTFTASAAISAEDVASVFASQADGDAGATVTGGAASHALTGFSSAAAVGSTVVFTSATTGNVPDLIATLDVNKDTLAIADRYLDLTAASGLPTLTGIEIVDLQMRGAGVSNSLKLDAASVIAMTNSDKTLRIDGQVGDVVMFASGDTWGKTSATINSLAYDVYTHTPTGAIVQVQHEISQDVVFASGANATLTGGSGLSSLVDYSNLSSFAYVNLSNYAQTLDVYAMTANSAKRDDSGVKTDTLSGVEWVKTGAGADQVILSETVANRVDLGSGNDIVWDLAIGATNNTSDTLLGGDGTDTLYYDRATSGITLDLIAGTSVINGVTDVIRDFETFVTGSGADTIYDNSDAHAIYAASGNDTIDGQAGNDTLDGGAGNDSIFGGEGADFVYGQAGNNSIWGGSGADYLYGQSSANYNDTGNNYVDGGLDNDQIWGGHGNDTLLGGDGADVIYGGGIAGVQGGNPSFYYYNLEWATSGSNMIDGGAGSDTLNGGDGADLILGGADNDLIGARINTSTWGTLFLEAGNDTLIGGTGLDTILGGQGDDLIYGGDDNDVLGDNTYEWGNDTFVGGAGDDIIYGGDYLSATWSPYGASVIRSDVVGGVDTLDYSASTYSVQVNLDDEAHTIAGVALAINRAKDGLGYTDAIYGIENAFGGTSNDILLGSAVANYLKGNEGNDTLWGAEGIDTLEGGTGDDVFYLDKADASVLGGDGTDTLYTRYVNTDLTDTTNFSVVLKDLEVVDLSAAYDTVAGGANVGNTLVLNQSAVYKMTTDVGVSHTHTLTVNGVIGDSVFFNDRSLWTQDATSYSGYRKLTSSYALSGTTYNLVVMVKEDVSTDVVRGTSAAANESLIGTNQTTSSAADVNKSMVDYADRIDAVRINLSSDRYDGVAARTVVSTAMVSVSTDVDTLSSLDGTLSTVEWAKTGSGDDWLIGSSVANRLEGGLGNDWLMAGLGNDTLVGGLGIDTADYSDQAAGVTITLNGDSIGSAVFTDTANNDDLYSIENVIGSNQADVITITDTNANWIDGGAGADSIRAGDGNDTLVFDALDTLDGEAGTDTLLVHDAALDLTAAGVSGTKVKNIEVIDMRGSQGSKLTLSVVAAAALSTTTDALTVYADDQDVVELVGTWTLGSNTVVNGSVYHTWNGTSTSPVAAATLTVSAEASVRMVGTSSGDTIIGSSNPDVLWGLAGADSLSGGDGDDTFVGGADNDSLVGGNGFDTADYSASTGPLVVNLTTGTATGDGTDTLTTIERVIATTGADTMTGSANADWLEGNAGDDSLSGAAGDDHLYGQSGADTLLGGDGADVLEGGIGNDSLDGGLGADALYGQAGDDTLVYDAFDGVIDGGEGMDTLYISDTAVDFVHGSHPVVQGIETLDLTNSTVTNLTLDLASVRAMSGTSNQLLINALSTDTLGLTDYAQWTLSSSYTGGVTTKQYTQDGVILKIVCTGDTTAVSNNATPSGSGTTVVGTDASNTVTGGSANDTLSPLGGGDSVNGGAGTDTLDLTPQFRVDTIGLSMSVDGQNNSYLVAVGDVNRDGFMDFAMRDADTNLTTAAYVYRDRRYYGSPNYVWTGGQSLSTYTYTSGDVYVVFGSAGGLGSLQINAGEAPTGASAGYIKLTSNASANEGFGVALGSLGDFNGDGQSELMIAARGINSYTYNIGDTYGSDGYSSPDSWTTSNEGRLYVFDGGNTLFTDRVSGSVTQTTLSTNGSGTIGQANALASTSSGYALYEDARSYDPQSATDVPNVQTTYTYSTSATSADVVYTGSTSSSALGSGWSPVSMGDLNGDGYDDFMAGTNAQIYFGHANIGSGFNAAATYLGTPVDLGDVGRIAAVGDIDGDGYQDMMVSSSDGATNYLVYGGSSASTWTAPAAWNSGAGSNGAPRLTKVVSETGITLNGTYSSLGDINGDGYDDLLISAFGTNASDPNDFNAKNNGGLYVVFGQSGHWNNGDLNLTDLATNKLGFRITGAVDFDNAGQYSWTGVGDMNGDGLDDFIFQAPGDNESSNAGATSLGSSYLIFGRQAGWQDISLLEMQDYGIQLLRTGNGYWTALGDVDGDGYDDVSLTNATTNLQIFYGDSYLTGDSNIAVKHIEGTHGETLYADAIKIPSNAKAADRLIGNAGDDTLVGNGGADVLLGGAGNDLLQVGFVDNDHGAMTDFFKIDGGTGIDTLEFKSTGTMDFTNLRNDLVENVEIFKLGAGNQTITLNQIDVLSITGETNTAIDNTTYQKGHVLVVDGTSGDTLNLVGGWNTTAVAQVNVSGYSGHSFSVYQHGSDNLYVAISDGIDASSRHIS
jgi:Ca2+-binding RTX toxin-like protein